MQRHGSEEQFDRQAQHYNAQWNQWSEESLRWLLSKAGALPQYLVLDVATGTGFTALAFAPLVAEVVGVDVSRGMLDQAERQARDAGIANVRFEQAAAESLPFAEGSFDLVTCRVAPHHFVSVEDFAAEAYRVLRPGGLLLVADTSVPDDMPDVGAWQNRVELLRDPSHIRNYTPAEWSRFVSTAGFTIEEVSLSLEPNAITLRAWLEKGGCKGEAAEEVRRSFEQAPQEACDAFAITTLPDGDISFNWCRVLVAAAKP